MFSCVPASMLTTDSKIFSTLCTGLHRSALLSYPVGSSPGACRMDIHTLPSGYTEIKKKVWRKPCSCRQNASNKINNAKTSGVGHKALVPLSCVGTDATSPWATFTVFSYVSLQLKEGDIIMIHEGVFASDCLKCQSFSIWKLEYPTQLG